MTTMASQITSLTIVYSAVYSEADHQNIKAPPHWPLCGEFTGTGEFPAQRASYAENVSIWWRHHDSHVRLHSHGRTSPVLETLVFPYWFSIELHTFEQTLKSKHFREDFSFNTPWPGLCVITAIWRCRKNFSQWKRSFHWKLRCHWLKFMRQCQIAVIIHGPVLLL